MIMLITGLMASGKSTVSELLAQQFDRGVHLRGDVFRRMIRSGREEMQEDHRRKRCGNCTCATG